MYECHPPHDDGHPFVPHREQELAESPLPQAGWAAALLLMGFGAFALGLNQTSAEAVVMSTTLFVAAAVVGIIMWLWGTLLRKNALIRIPTDRGRPDREFSRIA